ncbi:MAG: hypothetical protein JW719_02010 [Pirellulales bacterium]|nr:hypothetical protein [Pirellulales bacterium]
MFRRLKSTRHGSRLGWLLVALLAIATGMAAGGCGALNLRGDSFPRDETFSWSGRTRQADGEVDCIGFSNKARQIEQECGAR